MKKKIITITAPVAVIEAINLMLITLKPRSPAIQQIEIKRLNEVFTVCLN